MFDHVEFEICMVGKQKQWTFFFTFIIVACFVFIVCRTEYDSNVLVLVFFFF